VDASCILRWVQAYAPELNERCRPFLKPTNKSYRIDETYIDETYIKVKGEDRYLYRAVDSTGQTIEFLLAAKRDKHAAKRFLVKAIEASGNPMPRVLNVDNPAYPAAVEALKADGVIPRRVRLRQCKYLNNAIEQDHRTVKKRVWLAKGYGSFSKCLADAARNRYGEHDQERTSEMVTDSRFGSSGLITSLHLRLSRAGSSERPDAHGLVSGLLPDEK
jgi:IS6 family transposase